MILSLLQSAFALRVSLDNFITFENDEQFTCERCSEFSDIQDSAPFKDFTHTINVDIAIQAHMLENDNKKDDLLFAYKIADDYLFCITDEHQNVIEEGIIENKEDLEKYLDENNITGIYLISKEHNYYDTLFIKITEKINSPQSVTITEGGDLKNNDSDSENKASDLENNASGESDLKSDKNLIHLEHLFKDMVYMKFDEKDVITDIEKEFINLPDYLSFEGKKEIVTNEIIKIFINNLLKKKKFTLTKDEFEEIKHNSISTYMNHLINHVGYLEAFNEVFKYLRSGKENNPDSTVFNKIRVEEISDILINALAYTGKITFSKYL